MDYGTGETDMGKAAIRAIKALELQLDSLGLTNTKIGVIPMIGENDTRNDAPFTLDDARELYDYVASNSRVAELSFWSLGRDFPGNGEVSPIHSGMSQKDYDFSQIMQGV